MDASLAPVYAEFGAAVHDAQTLEQGLRLAVALARESSHCNLDSTSRKEVHGLHNLLELAQKECLLDESDAGRLRNVKAVRNELIHEFWSTRAGGMFTPYGRRRILAEVTSIRTQLIEAGKIVDRLVDRYLVRLGTDIDTVKAQIGASLEEDADDPFLH